MCSTLYISRFRWSSKRWRSKAGVEIVKKALQAPVRQITANAGVDGSVVVGKLLEGKKSSQGYDAQNEEYVDMFAKGIIDPTKVVDQRTRCRLNSWTNDYYWSNDRR